MALDMDTYLKFPRVSGLLVAPDGKLTVQSAVADPTGKAFAAEVLELDPSGENTPRRLAGRRIGLAAAGFEPDGSLLLLDKRPDPEADPDDPSASDDSAALWRLPAGGGEPQYVTGTPGGVTAVQVARETGTIVLISEVFPSAGTLGEDREKAKAREKAGTSALLFEGYPFRFWDSPYAPRAPRLFAVGPDGTPRDLTGAVGGAITGDPAFDITPDGRTVLVTWNVPTAKAGQDRTLAAIDVETGERRSLLHDPGFLEMEVVCSPDSRHAAVVRNRVHTTESPWEVELWIVSLADGSARRLAKGFEHFPGGPRWTPDGRALLFSADEAGRQPLWRVDVDDENATPVRLSAEGAFNEIRVAPDGSAVYAVRSSWALPPEVVRLDPNLPDQQPTVLYAPETPAALPGKLEEVHATAEDGTALRAWLITPPGSDGPAPLVVIPHGGPVHSWNAWSWRWQPHLFAARGYAVLLPDPALSTGYGRTMVERGWQEWGGRPYTDILALTDAALERPDLDAERTAVAGASYGGYMTNWILGHTDRFRCAISHASLWNLLAFRPSTDDLVDWELWFGDPVERADFYREWSPSTYAANITTPTLVIHGERDYRCPIGEGLSLYGELQRHGVESAFLYLPDEGHWVLKPGNVKVWYETVLSWLDHHLLGQPWERPELV